MFLFSLSVLAFSSAYACSSVCRNEGPAGNASDVGTEVNGGSQPTMSCLATSRKRPPSTAGPAVGRSRKDIRR